MGFFMYFSENKKEEWQETKKWLDRLILKDSDLLNWSKDLWKWLWRNTLFAVLKKKWVLNQDNSPKEYYLESWLFKFRYSEARLYNWIVKSYKKPIITEKWIDYFSRSRLLSWKEELELRNLENRWLPNWKKLPWKY